MAEPGDTPLMPPIRPLRINLSLKFQHVKFTSRMSAWTCDIAFEKKNEFEMK